MKAITHTVSNYAITAVSKKKNLALSKDGLLYREIPNKISIG